MKKFKYTAINIEKKKFSGIFLAENEDHLARMLAEQSLYLIKASPVKRETANAFFSVSGKLTTNELATMCRQFSIMISTGIPIIDSIEILKSQDYSGLLKRTLEFIYEDVKSGLLLSKAFEKHNKLFPKFLVSMIYVGEVSGSLDKILNTLADYFESEERIKKKTKSAMTYPIVLLVMAIGIIVLMVVFIIPTFMSALSKLDVEMPAITLFLYNMSNYLKANWKKIFMVLLAVVLLFILFIKSKRGSYLFDKFKFRGPIIGKINQNLITARFARAFGLLIDGGQDVVDAMDTVKIVLGNKYVEDLFEKATNDVRQGMSITVALGNYKLFAPLIIQMISVGEKTGSLGDVLVKSCSFFDNEAEAALSGITTFIQPVLLMLIGGTVGVLFYAVYSPLLQIMNGITV